MLLDVLETFFGCAVLTLPCTIASNAFRVDSAVDDTCSSDGRSIDRLLSLTSSRSERGTRSLNWDWTRWPSRRPCWTMASYWGFPSLSTWSVNTFLAPWQCESSNCNFRNVPTYWQVLAAKALALRCGRYLVRWHYLQFLWWRWSGHVIRTVVASRVLLVVGGVGSW